MAPLDSEACPEVALPHFQNGEAKLGRGEIHGALRVKVLFDPERDLCVEVNAFDPVLVDDAQVEATAVEAEGRREFCASCPSQDGSAVFGEVPTHLVPVKQQRIERCRRPLLGGAGAARKGEFGEGGFDAESPEGTSRPGRRGTTRGAAGGRNLRGCPILADIQ